jgi:opacity protein-like surface antigen
MNTRITNKARGLLGAICLVALPVTAQAEEYFKFQLGLTAPEASDAYWLPKGFPNDPQVNFDIDDLGTTGFGSLAVGHAYANGLRADVEFLFTGRGDATGACSSASNGSSCFVHSDITDAEVRSKAIMANVTYEFAMSGALKPFVTAGVGYAQNTLSDWTRTANPGNPTTRPVRTFEGSTENSFAWTLGVGASYEVTSAKQPLFIDVSYRYFDLGSVEGGRAPTSDNGASPDKGLSFDMASHALTVGLRIPF